jgi:hypothetical protein
VPSTEAKAKSAHVASVARGALGPRRAQTKGRRRRIGGGASAKHCVRSQKGSGELAEGVLEVQFPDCEVRAVFEYRPDAESEFLR